MKRIQLLGRHLQMTGPISIDGAPSQVRPPQPAPKGLFRLWPTVSCEHSMCQR